MNHQKSLVSFVLLGLLMLTGLRCKKYDQGGLVRSTEKNLIQAWTLQKYLRNGADETSLLHIKNYEETYSGSDNYSRTYIDKDNKSVSETGTWKFDEEQEKLSISGVSSLDLSANTGTVSSSYYTIVKLTKKEYWYSFKNGSEQHEFHFVKK